MHMHICMQAYANAAGNRKRCPGKVCPGDIGELAACYRRPLVVGFACSLHSFISKNCA